MGDRVYCDLFLFGEVPEEESAKFLDEWREAEPTDESLPAVGEIGDFWAGFEEVNSGDYGRNPIDLKSFCRKWNLSFSWHWGAGCDFCAGGVWYDCEKDADFEWIGEDGPLLSLDEALDPDSRENYRNWAAWRKGKTFQFVPSPGHIGIFGDPCELPEQSAHKNVFVFGSNKDGRHGKGAAKFAALNCGAIFGQGEGLQGSSYAIPTKGHNLVYMDWREIEPGIDTFLKFAAQNPDTVFHLTPIGCGLAGKKVQDLLQILAARRVPENVVLTTSWIEHFIT